MIIRFRCLGPNGWLLHCHTLISSRRYSTDENDLTDVPWEHRPLWADERTFHGGMPSFDELPEHHAFLPAGRSTDAIIPAPFVTVPVTDDAERERGDAQMIITVRQWPASLPYRTAIPRPCPNRLVRCS